jgi:DNA-binding transcriptional ArsR family regulator
METKAVIRALEALAQESRLSVYRALVQAGPAGLTPSKLADMIGLASPTLSFHLSRLRDAGLVTVKRSGRSLAYATDYSAMNQVIGFLTENCCGGAPCSTQPSATRIEGRKRK